MNIQGPTLEQNEFDEGFNNLKPQKVVDASLVICSFNRPSLLIDTVDSVLKGQWIPAELIIIDQSIDPHPELASANIMNGCHIRYFNLDQIGVSLARNQGIYNAIYEHIVLLDDDMYVEPNWFKVMVDSLIAEGANGIITGQVRNKIAEDGGFAPSIKEEEVPTVYRGKTVEDVLYTGNMAICRSTFCATDGFDQRLGPGTPFPAAEDNDFGYRWLVSGKSIHYNPEAIVFHRAWRNQNETVRLHQNYGIGQGAAIAKHLLRGDAFLLLRLAYNVLGLGSLGIRHLFKRDLLLAFCQIVFIISIFLGGLQWTFRERHHQQVK